MIRLPGLKLTQKHVYDRVFELFTSLPIDYVDAYHAALIEHRKQQELYGFDRHFDRIPGLRRLAP